MNRTVAFLKKWTLPVSMLVGALSYLGLSALRLPEEARKLMMDGVRIVQPTLLFCMLLMTFCRIRFRDMKFCRWQLWMLLFQSLAFIGLGALLLLVPHTRWYCVAEGAMICLVCPTATAAAVVTSKLGGNAGSLTLYTVMINLCVAILVPLFVPLLHPDGGQTFLQSFLLIISKVFPLLIGPIFLAAAMRRFVPKAVQWLTAYRDIPFYLWAVALALAIAVTVRTIVHSRVPVEQELGIAIASLLACIVQFAFGRYVGRRYGEPISAAQSCGQKNTVLAIWMGYTFFTPITAIAGGFYSIWHNVWNSWQLAHQPAPSPSGPLSHQTE